MVQLQFRIEIKSIFLGEKWPKQHDSAKDKRHKKKNKKKLYSLEEKKNHKNVILYVASGNSEQAWNHFSDLTELNSPIFMILMRTVWWTNGFNSFGRAYLKKKKKKSISISSHCGKKKKKSHSSIDNLNLPGRWKRPCISFRSVISTLRIVKEQRKCHRMTAKRHWKLQRSPRLKKKKKKKIIKKVYW